MDKLKPCSCGNKSRLTNFYENEDGILVTYSVVVCDECNEVTKESYKSDKEAVDAWNRIDGSGRTGIDPNSTVNQAILMEFLWGNITEKEFYERLNNYGEMVGVENGKD